MISYNTIIFEPYKPKDVTEKIYESILKKMAEDILTMVIDFASANDLNLDAIIKDFKDFLDNAV